MSTNRNIYMGRNSTARIPMHGVLDSDKEALANIYATAYDSINNIMLTRNPEQIQRMTIIDLQRKFSILKLICRKRCPHMLDEIQTIESLSIANARGNISDKVFLRRIRHYVDKHGLNPSTINMIENRIDSAEMFARRNMKMNVPRPRLITLPRIFIPHMNNTRLSQLRPIKMRSLNFPRLRYPNVPAPRPMNIPRIRYPNVPKPRPINIPRIRLNPIKPWPVRNHRMPGMIPPPRRKRLW